jgi:hypothetical protein
MKPQVSAVAAVHFVEKPSRLLPVGCFQAYVIAWFIESSPLEENPQASFMVCVRLTA